ncbi:hypothetical protein Moror_7662 [Moniliophthora roreri MCA 2997]|uniref:Uncharacterized protein n=1 Tax=Moniliophthora roreri (strain MCA 2997) TaxID=1381753 RepID=V2YF16_MONRO|nr:hypothetical protein Moror_7662 [Moniliophthora roreri MCA 2997]
MNDRLPQYANILDAQTLGVLINGDEDFFIKDLMELGFMPKMVYIIAYIYAKPTPASPSASDLPPITEARACVKREDVAYAAQKRPSPSTGAKNSTLLTVQKKDNLDAAYNARPPAPSPPPLSLYCAAFHEFNIAMAEPTDLMEFTTGELQQASEFAMTSLPHYESETVRQAQLQALNLLGRQSLWESKATNLGQRDIKLDGVASVCYLVFQYPIHTVFMDLRNAVGEGSCDPSEQAQCGSILNWSSPKYAPIRQVSCRPSFLIGPSGGVLAVWGGTFADRFYFECLALVYVGPQPMASAVNVLQAGAISQPELRWPIVYGRWQKSFRCLEHGPNTLELPPPHVLQPTRKSLHSGSSTSSTPGHNNPSCDTHFPRWRWQTGFLKSPFSAPIRRHFQRSLLSSLLADIARKHTRSWQRTVLPHRCTIAHMRSLLGIGQSYIEGTTEEDHFPGAEQKLVLQRVISLLHSNGLVFGDLCWPNIITNKIGVYLTDFEWAGPEGVTRYPTDLDGVGLARGG